MTIDTTLTVHYNKWKYDNLSRTVKYYLLLIRRERILLPLISFVLYVFFAAYLMFGIYVLLKQKSSLRNRMLFSMCLHLSIWSLGYALMSNAPSAEKANFWRIVASLGWCFVYSVWLDFAILVQDENTKWMTDFRRLIMYLPSVFFFCINLRFKPEDSVERFELFWRDKYPCHSFEYMFSLYYLVYILIGIFIIYRWGRKAILYQEKKQAKVIIITGLISLALGIVVEKILPLFMKNVFPLDIIVFSIAILGLFHAITRFQMMTLTSQIASDYVLDTISDPVILIDKNLLIMEINNATLELTGYTKEELLGLPFYILLPDRESLKFIILSGPVNNIEVGLLSKSNKVIPCLFSETNITNEYSDDIGIACIFHDITDRKNAELIILNRQNELESIVYERTKELKEINRQLEEKIAEQKKMEESLKANEEMFRALVMQSSDGIVVMDNETKECLECNNIAKKFLGLTEDQLPIISNEKNKIMNYDVLAAAMKNLVNGDVDSIKETIKYSKEDGEFRNFELSSTYIRYSNKQFLMLTVRDVTEEIIMEERNQQITRMESLATLSGGIAHDFNNILAGIMGYTQLSIQEIEDGESILADNLNEISKLGVRGKKLVSQILTFSKKSATNLDNVNLNQIIEDVLKLINLTFPANIGIVYLPGNEPCYVYADSAEIHQMVMNLCVNACTAMSTSGGILTVKLSSINIDRDMVVHFQTLRTGRYIEIEVTDNGCGMDETVKKRIFEPFYTTRGNHGGTGLGLSVVHGIISRMKGVILVESTPGEGSTFTIYLPASNNEVTVQPVIKKLDINNSARVLLVDDEETIVTSSVRMLQQKGFTVTGVIDPREAYQLFRNNKDAFDILITDQSMPNMSGDILMKELRLIKPELPVIICSGYLSDFDYDEDDNTIYLIKPVVLDEYINAIERLI